jgi:hypothetical protein
MESIGPSDNGDIDHDVGGISRIIGGVVFIDISKEKMRHETYTGMLYHIKKEGVFKRFKKWIFH